jgi:integrase
MSEQRVVVWVQEFYDRDILQLQWNDPETGRRRTKSTGTADPKAAERMRADHEADLNAGRYQEPGKLEWEEFRKMFEEEYAALRRHSSQEKFKSVFDVFEQTMNPGKLSAITERTISVFVRKLTERKGATGKIGLAKITIRNYLIALRTALSWAGDQKLIQAVPKFPYIKVTKKKPQPVPAEAFEKLLEKAPDQHFRAFLLCGWYCGLRLSEARHLRWKESDRFPWIDFPGNRIVLPGVFAKSDEDQWMPLHPVLREALDSLERASDCVFQFTSRYTGDRSVATPSLIESWPSPSAPAFVSRCTGSVRDSGAASPNS